MDSHRDSCFEKIKTTFDAAFSYIVIEDKGGYIDDPAFLKVDEALLDLEKQILHREVCIDQKTGRNILIVKMEHQDTEEIMLKLLKTSLGKDFNCYVY
jgi:hypothetical protein